MHLQLFIRKILYQFATINIKALIGACVAHYLIAYGLFYWAGETALVSSHTEFFYYWVVTSSTVGYGDMSPSTPVGMWIVSLFMIPFSLGLFGIILSKFGRTALIYLRKEITGMRDFSNTTNHILIMGYHPQRTAEMIQLILADKHREDRLIIVATAADIEHPFLEIHGVEFAKLTSLKDPTSLARVGLEKADRILVDGEDDNESFVLSSRYAMLNPNAHITTHIVDTGMADHLQQQHDNIEVVVDNREELMIRTMQDNGSSRTVNQLLRANEGQTFFSSKIPCADHSVAASYLHHALRDLESILIGYARDPLGRTLILNPASDSMISLEEPLFVFYIAKNRLSGSDIMEKLRSE